MEPGMPSGGGRRVLVVDDDADVADSLVDLLSALGHESHAAYGGAQALETAARIEPEVVIVDIALPDMDGEQVARRLRASHGGVRLVALSGYVRSAGRGVDDRSSFDHELVKPVDIDCLEALLREQ